MDGWSVIIPPFGKNDWQLNILAIKTMPLLAQYVDDSAGEGLLVYAGVIVFGMDQCTSIYDKLSVHYLMSSLI